MAKKKVSPPARRSRPTRAAAAPGWTKPEFSVKLQLAYYELTDNPLHAWGAYRECRDGKLPIPDSVLSYFDRIAARFGDLTSAGHMPPAEPSAAIAEALEMKRPGQSGRGNRFKTYDVKKETMLAAQAGYQIDRLKATSQRKLTKAFKDVAKAHGWPAAKGFSPATVRRAFDMFKPWLPADGVIKIKK